MHDLLAELFVCVGICARVCVLCVFTVDIADKLVGSDWTCAMSRRRVSPQMKMGFFGIKCKDGREIETNERRLLLSVSVKFTCFL